MHSLYKGILIFKQTQLCKNYFKYGFTIPNDLQPGNCLKSRHHVNLNNKDFDVFSGRIKNIYLSHSP